MLFPVGERYSPRRWGRCRQDGETDHGSCRLLARRTTFAELSRHSRCSTEAMRTIVALFAAVTASGCTSDGIGSGPASSPTHPRVRSASAHLEYRSAAEVDTRMWVIHLIEDPPGTDLDARGDGNPLLVLSVEDRLFSSPSGTVRIPASTDTEALLPLGGVNDLVSDQVTGSLSIDFADERVITGSVFATGTDRSGATRRIEATFRAPVYWTSE